MTYAVRVRLYCGDIRGPELEPQADTDPDLKDGAPGSERAEGLEGVGQVLRDLCEAMHTPSPANCEACHGSGWERWLGRDNSEEVGPCSACTPQLLGLSDMANGAYLASMREHIGKTRALTYQQSYSVKAGHRVDWWFARVDVHLLVSP